MRSKPWLALVLVVATLACSGIQLTFLDAIPPGFPISLPSFDEVSHACAPHRGQDGTQIIVDRREDPRGVTDFDQELTEQGWKRLDEGRFERDGMVFDIDPVPLSTGLIFTWWRPGCEPPDVPAP